MDLKYADKVLNAAVDNGNSKKEIQAHLDSLDADGQEKFINETGEFLGINRDQDQQFNDAKLLSASRAIDVADTSVGSILSAGIEKGLAKGADLLGLGTEGSQQILKTPIRDLAKETREFVNSQDNPELTNNIQLGTQIAASVSNPIAGITIAATNEGLKGGLKEAALQGLGLVGTKILAKYGSKVASKVIGKQGEQAVSASNKLLRSKLFKANELQKLGKHGAAKADDMIAVLKENGLFSKGVSMENMLQAIDDIKAFSGTKLGEIQQILAGQPAAKLEDIASGITAIEKKYAGRNLTQAQSNMLSKGIDDVLAKFDQNMNIDMQDLIKLKQELGEVAFNRGIKEDLTPIQELYNVVREGVETAANKVGGDVGNQLRYHNKLYSSALETGKKLSKRITEQEARKIVNVSDLIAGGVTLAAGAAVPQTAAVIVSKKMADKYGVQLSSIGLQKLGEAAIKSSKSLGKYAPILSEQARKGTLGAYHFLLSQQDPSYRRLSNKIMGIEGGDDE